MANEDFTDDDEEDTYYYDSAKEQVKIFACRHTFHIRCLKKHYKQKGIDVFAAKKNEKLRCPTCNLRNYDIENEKPSRGVPVASKVPKAKV